MPFAARTSGEHRRLASGELWGKLWDCAWMHVTGEIPAGVQDQKLVLLIDFNGEGCVVDQDGNPILGLTTINSEFDKRLGLPGKRVVPLSLVSVQGQAIDFWID